jgi:hypothetical protein
VTVAMALMVFLSFLGRFLTLPNFIYSLLAHFKEKPEIKCPNRCAKLIEKGQEQAQLHFLAQNAKKKYLVEGVFKNENVTILLFVQIASSKNTITNPNERYIFHLKSYMARRAFSIS